MANNDITFKIENGCFNYRVAAIIINNGKFLMCNAVSGDYYYSVGGRVKINETAEAAILRELKEETGINFEIDRLGFIHENFFVEEASKVRFHEIAFFYYMKLNPMINLICGSFFEKSKTKDYLAWIDLDKIENLRLYPEFFKTELATPKLYPQHIITNMRTIKLK